MRDHGCMAAWKYIIISPSTPGAQRCMQNWRGVMGESCWFWLLPQTNHGGDQEVAQGIGTGAVGRELVNACEGGGGAPRRRRVDNTVRGEELVDGCLIPSSG